MFICIVAQFFCGMASVTANSRMIYAFSRDGALPGSKYWHRINPKTRTPTNSVWLGVTLVRDRGCELAVRQGKGAGRYSTAFFALTGICVIGLYISYAIPIYLRLTNPDFQVGPWNLKGKHQLVGWTSLVVDRLDLVLFFAPLFWPFWGFWATRTRSWNRLHTRGRGRQPVFRQNNFNFTGPLILLAAICASGRTGASAARSGSRGPKVQGTPEELAAIEHELDALEHGTL